MAGGAPAVRVGREMSGRDLLREYRVQLLGGFPAPSRLDLFDDADVAEACALSRDQFLWTPQSPASITGPLAAARFCIDLLRTRPDLRRRFPHALSEGREGVFARWLTTEGARLYGLTSEACVAIGDAFAGGLSDRARQTYLLREDLQRAFPLALTPAGRRDLLLRWLLTERTTQPALGLENIWWFALECAEDPARELIATYRFTPEWQRIHPDGLTVFGRAKLADWLARSYRLEGDWLDLRPVAGCPDARRTDPARLWPA